VKTIDLRSDTVTRPTAAMREAMAKAEIGDDVYGEDPEANRLQAVAAELLGKQAALFVPSGTMANQAAIAAWTRPGDVVLAGEGAHILFYEGGATSAHAGCQITTLGTGGLFSADDVRAAAAPDEQHYAPTTLVAVENTHNRGGGVVFPLAEIRAIETAARENGMHLHLDGARIFNAAIASGASVRELAEPFDTVAFCLSKGLGAPVGSMVCGDEETIRRCHRMRKRMGGGMRQIGMLAAAGLHALEHHVDRLADDHAHAARLAAGLRELGFRVESEPQTNIVMFGVEDVMGFVRETRSRELLMNPMKPGILRAVTHLDVDAQDVEDALERIRAARDALA
jgi:threonine aldolase